VNINDKHMMRWVRVEDVGDTEFLVEASLSTESFISGIIPGDHPRPHGGGHLREDRLSARPEGERDDGTIDPRRHGLLVVSAPFDSVWLLTQSDLAQGRRADSGGRTPPPPPVQQPSDEDMELDREMDTWWSRKKQRPEGLRKSSSSDSQHEYTKGAKAMAFVPFVLVWLRGAIVRMTSGACYFPAFNA
jgi:hypothetical protein